MPAKPHLQVSLMYSIVYIVSMFFPALSAIFKERIFSEASEKLGGQKLDLFAVNSFGSASQALFVFLLLPVLSSLRGIAFQELPQYLTAGTVPVMLGRPIVKYFHGPKQMQCCIFHTLLSCKHCAATKSKRLNGSRRLGRLFMH